MTRTVGVRLAVCTLVVGGAFALLYVFIVGGQAYPQDLFPGFEIRSSFADGVVQTYAPSAYELTLGIAGAFLAALFAGLANLAAAQEYPNKIVRLVIPFPPGGSSEVKPVWR